MWTELKRVLDDAALCGISEIWIFWPSMHMALLGVSVFSVILPDILALVA